MKSRKYPNYDFPTTRWDGPTVLVSFFCIHNGRPGFTIMTNSRFLVYVGPFQLCTFS